MHDDETPATTDEPRDGGAPEVPPDTTPLFEGSPLDSSAATDANPFPTDPDRHGTVATRAEPDDRRGGTDETTTIPLVPSTPVDRGTRPADGDLGIDDPLVADTMLDDGPGRSGRSARWWAIVAIPLVVLLLAAGWIGWLFAERAGEAMPGVVVEGFDAGGMTGDEIESRLQDFVATRQEATITVTAGDSSFDYRLGDEGYGADLDSTVDAALSAGRDGPVGSVFTHVEAAIGSPSWTFDLQGVSVDRDVDAFLASIDDAIDLDATAGSVTIDADALTVTSEAPQEGFDARVDAIRDDFVALLGTGESATLDVPVDTLPPLVDPARVTQTVERAEAVLAESYVLTAGGDSLTIDPSEVAPYLAVVDVDGGYDVRLDRDGVSALLSDGRGDKFAVSPRSASYKVVSGSRTFDDKGSATFDPSPARVDLIEGRNGRAFRPEVATDLLMDLFTNEEHQGAFELEVVPAEFTNEEARAAQPDALLGTFTTYHDAGGNRVKNIHLLADLIDGEVLPPGDDFSVNRDIGDRTKDKGFLPDGTIVDGELEDTIGGGVSQLATTFYNAAFFAGIDVLSWKPHSWPISRYPLAREATFSYAGGLDIHILNNTQGALVVTTSYTSTSITMSIFGQDDGREVSAIMGEPHDYRDFDVIRRTTDELPDGQTRTVQSGGEGFTVDYTRVIKGGNNAGSDDFSWTYSPKPTIIETGTG